MREYEIVYIFDPTLEEEEIESKLDSYHERISDDGSGEVTAVEDWGKRKLAYPIENQENGHYVVAHFTLEPDALEEFERPLNLDGDLLRHLVVLHEGELPTPPSARRAGAGPEEGEDAGDGDAEEEAPESEEPEEEAEEEPEDEAEEESDEEAEEESDVEAEEESDVEAELEGDGDEEPAEDEESDDEEEKE